MGKFGEKSLGEGDGLQVSLLLFRVILFETICRMVFAVIVVLVYVYDRVYIACHIEFLFTIYQTDISRLIGFDLTTSVFTPLLKLLSNDIGIHSVIHFNV